MKCPSCAQETAAADLCQRCGATLRAQPCRKCQRQLPPGVRACAACGTPTRASQWMGALVGALAAGVLVGGFFLWRSERGAAPASAPTATPPPAASAPVSAPRPAAPAAPRTPREQADQLFNQAMQTNETGTPAQARPLIASAVEAYEKLPELDTDGFLHIALLQMAAGEHREARTTAEQILAINGQHLLGLGVGARAAAAAGDAAGARAYQKRLLAAWEAEVDRDLPEYAHHARLLDLYREEAQKAGGR